MKNKLVLISKLVGITIRKLSVILILVPLLIVGLGLTAIIMFTNPLSLINDVFLELGINYLFDMDEWKKDYTNIVDEYG